MASNLYVSTYCNFAHRLSDGKPVRHECRIIPVRALRMEYLGNIERAIQIMQATPTRYMRHGVKE